MIRSARRGRRFLRWPGLEMTPSQYPQGLGCIHHELWFPDKFPGLIKGTEWTCSQGQQWQPWRHQDAGAEAFHIVLLLPSLHQERGSCPWEVRRWWESLNTVEGPWYRISRQTKQAIVGLSRSYVGLGSSGRLVESYPCRGRVATLVFEVSLSRTKLPLEVTRELCGVLWINLPASGHTESGVQRGWKWGS